MLEAIVKLFTRTKCSISSSNLSNTSLTKALYFQSMSTKKILAGLRCRGMSAKLKVVTLGASLGPEKRAIVTATSPSILPLVSGYYKGGVTVKRLLSFPPLCTGGLKTGKVF